MYNFVKPIGYIKVRVFIQKNGLDFNSTPPPTFAWSSKWIMNCRFILSLLHWRIPSFSFLLFSKINVFSCSFLSVSVCVRVCICVSWCENCTHCNNSFQAEVLSSFTLFYFLSIQFITFLSYSSVYSLFAGLSLAYKFMYVYEITI